MFKVSTMKNTWQEGGGGSYFGSGEEGKRMKEKGRERQVTEFYQPLVHQTKRERKRKRKRRVPVNKCYRINYNVVCGNKAKVLSRFVLLFFFLLKSCIWMETNLALRFISSSFLIYLANCSCEALTAVTHTHTHTHTAKGANFVLVMACRLALTLG